MFTSVQCFIVSCIVCLPSDIDECEEATDDCPEGACENTPGTFICKCPEGQVLVGDKCEGEALLEPGMVVRDKVPM